MPRLVRTLIWQRQDGPGAEYFGLWRDGSGWQLRGTAIVPLEGVPARVRYGIVCDASWRTRAVHVALRTGQGERALHLTGDGTGTWDSSGEPAPEVQGCLDIDLEITPATNMLPIRRLDLGVGRSTTVSAAWLRFPELTIEPLPQRYTRIGTRRYRYESGPEFRAIIEVDELGMVSRYGDSWTCIAREDAAPGPG